MENEGQNGRHSAHSSAGAARGQGIAAARTSLLAAYLPTEREISHAFRLGMDGAARRLADGQLGGEGDTPENFIRNIILQGQDGQESHATRIHTPRMKGADRSFTPF